MHYAKISPYIIQGPQSFMKHSLLCGKYSWVVFALNALDVFLRGWGREVYAENTLNNFQALDTALLTPKSVSIVAQFVTRTFT